MINTKTEKVETASSQRQVTLPDGTLAYLNGNSILTYPKTFGAKQRLVTLSGEAFFKVTKNLVKPFIVETQSARIKVLGTSFNVLAPPRANRVEVLVKTGMVSLSPIHNQNDRLYLKKGDFGLMESGKTKRALDPGENYLSWQTKRFQFKNETLKDVTEVLNHAYITHILLASDSLKQLRLTSTYNKVSLETIVKSLCLTFHLKSTQNGNDIVLSAVN
jgi:ferric-dicitrate binding protein FerR (iron transport regulator)